MKIALVSPFDPNPKATADRAASVGGVERVFAEVSRRLAARGHDVTLLCSSDNEQGKTMEQGVRVVRSRRVGTVLRAPIAALDRHIPADADLVHVAATYPFTTPLVLRRAHRLGIPSVLDFHFEPAANHLAGRMAAQAYRLVGPRAYPLARFVVLRSHAYGDRAPSLARVPRDRWRIVPNGIEPTRFHAGPNDGGDYLLFVGRLVPYKGLRVLLHALAQRDLGLPLVIAGDGPLRPELEALAHRLGVDARFLGRVQDEDLPTLYRRARLTVLPSVNGQEAFGITLIESMACGTPVVASALPGVADVARVGGLTAPVGDAVALAATLEEALTPGVLERGPALAARVHARYSWDAVTQGLVNVYEEAAQEGAALRRP